MKHLKSFENHNYPPPPNPTYKDKTVDDAANLLVSFYDASGFESFLDKLKKFNDMVGCNIPMPTDHDEMLKLLLLIEEDEDLSFALSDDILNISLEKFRQKMNDIGIQFGVYKNPKTKTLVQSGII